MKSKSLLLIFAATATISFVSCKKNTDTTDEFETTFELSGDQGVTNNLTQDDEDVLNETAVNNNLAGSNFADGPGFPTSSGVGGTSGTTGILGCATITITPAASFPKTIVIDFGTSCVSPSGVVRSGKINVVLTDSLRKSGSSATMTFNNYYVSGFKREGTIVWLNTSPAPGQKSWRRTVTDGKITAPSGNYWLHSGVQDITQTAGISTPFDLTDDVFSITGNFSVTNSAGRNRTGTVLTALEKKTACDNIDMGTMKIQGPNHYATLDFGNGTCDNLATISIDGRPPRTIILR
jgi:hypothetical protein